MSQRLGEKWVWFYGEVVNVKDPHKSGRVQVRVKGYHDDKSKIPDEKLPWAQVILPVTSASVHKVGASPTGLLPKSKVVGFWFDPDDLRIPIILGTVGSAGDLDEKGGVSKGGKIPPNEKTNSTNPLARPKGKDDAGGDRNPKVLKNALDPKTERPNDDSLEKKSITEVAKDKLKFPDQKTIGLLTKDLKSDVLGSISKIDPSNISGAIPSALSSLLKIDAISSLGNASGLFKMASSALQTMMAQAINNAGGSQNDINKVLNTLLAFIQSPEFLKLSAEHQQTFLKAVSDLADDPKVSPIDTTINPTQILSGLTNGISSASNPAAVMDAVATTAINGVSSQFSNILNGRNLNASALTGIMNNLSSSLASEGIKAIMGSSINPANLLSQASQLLGSSGTNLLNVVNKDLPKTVNNGSKIQNTLTDALKNLSRVKKKKEQNPYEEDLAKARELATNRVKEHLAAGATSGTVTATVGGATVTQTFTAG